MNILLYIFLRWCKRAPYNENTIYESTSVILYIGCRKAIVILFIHLKNIELNMNMMIKTYHKKQQAYTESFQCVFAFCEEIV